MNVQTHPGYYGKIPSKGDFVTRHLPRSFITCWDEWLQSSIAASKAQLGEQWLDYYLTCPIWRFIISNEVCNEQAWAGIIIPSVDSVGRYFPFSVTLPLGTSNQLLAIANNEDEWFAQAEALALTALDQHQQLDELNQSFDALSPPSGLTMNGNGNSDAPAQENSRADLNDNGHWHLSCEEHSSISTTFITLLEQLLDERFTHFSAWWTHGSEHVEPCLLICEGLPTPESFSALLDGQWQARGWDTHLSTTAAASAMQPHSGVESA